MEDRRGEDRLRAREPETIIPLPFVDDVDTIISGPVTTHHHDSHSHEVRGIGPGPIRGGDECRRGRDPTSLGRSEPGSPRHPRHHSERESQLSYT